MKLKFIILGLSLQIITSSSYSQDSSIVSLTIGNKWIYDLNYESSSDSAYGVQTKEIIGDTTSSLWICACDSSYYFPLLLQWKIVNILTNINNVLTSGIEYWYSDSSVFIKNSIFFLGPRYVYDAYQLSNSTCIGFFNEDANAEYIITLQEDTLWGKVVNTQNWKVSWHFPTSPYEKVLESECNAYFGPLNEFYGVFDFQGNWSKQTASLKGALVNGTIYGDTTTVSVYWNLKPRTNFSLVQNYPNPFNPTTNIEFRITDFGFVSLKVYDVLGNEIATLVNEEKPAGEYEVEFNANSHSGEVRNLTSGIYFYQLRAGDYTETKKMVLLK